MNVFKRFVGACAVSGYLAGLAYAGLEGLQAALAIQMGPSSKTLHSWIDLGTTIAIPLLVYPLLATVVSTVLSTLAYLVLGRLLAKASEGSLIASAVGLVAAAGAGLWALFTSNPFITLSFILSPARILFNLQAVGIGVLAGVGVGWVVSRAVRRWTPRGIALSFASLCLSALASSLALVWVKRNLGVLQRAPSAVVAVVALGVAFLALTLGLRLLFGALYRPARPWMARLAPPVVLPVGLVAFLLFATREEFHLMEGGKGGKGIKIILFSIDTLRADRLGCYGYHRPTSPVMDAIAAEGTLFLEARSQSPWTLSSIASFMTSTYPSVNRVLTGNNKLDSARTTLAEVLRDQGILTQAIVTNGWLQDVFGIAQGFDGFRHSGEVFNWGRYQRTLWMRIARRFWPERFPLNQTFLARDVVDRAIQWLRLHHDRDFFLWIHTVDPHDPYQPPSEYQSLFADSSYRGRFRETSGLLNNLRSGARISPEEKLQLQRLYDREVRYTDDEMGRLVAALRELGVWDQTLFIITSDHGEEFWEHDGIMHGHTLYDENLLVPLIMRLPGRIPAGRVVREPVMLLDLMPTILDLYGLPGSPEMQGTSVVPLLTGTGTLPPRPFFAEALLYFDELKSVLWDGLKLIYNPGSGKTMLFNLRQDPHERWDLARSDSVRAQELRSTLQEWMDQSLALSATLPHTPDGSRARIDPETEAQLRALGYLN